MLLDNEQLVHTSLATVPCIVCVFFRLDAVQKVRFAENLESL